MDIMQPYTDIPGVESQENKNNPKTAITKPKRAIILSAFIAFLMFCIMIINIICSFLMKLATNNEFMTQMTHLISQIKTVMRRSIIEKNE